jgi:formylglycine-generating enzyme required for sulfatase activity
MLGNVWEWTHDWYGEYRGEADDPVGPASGEVRVFRGASWFFDAQYVRSANRGRGAPAGRGANLGFRAARSL